MILESFPVGPLQCNCSILGDEASGTALVIDPGGDAERIVGVLQEHGLRASHLLHTHAHIDHVGATNAVRAARGGEAALHRGDEWLIEHLDVQGRMIGLPEVEAVAIDRWLEEGDTFTIGGRRLETLHTPGHSPGSCAFVVDWEGRTVVFAGDTLFAGSIGRTDLWGGDTPTIMDSLQGKLMELDDETLVVTGHGPSTTIGRERAGNPFLTGRWRLG